MVAPKQDKKRLWVNVEVMLATVDFDDKLGNSLPASRVKDGDHMPSKRLALPLRINA